MGKSKEWGIASLVFGLISIIPSYLIYQHQMSYEGRIDYLGNGQYIEYFPNYDVVNLMIMGMIVGFIFSIIGIVMILGAIGPRDSVTRPIIISNHENDPARQNQSLKCPYCGYDAGVGAIRCPRCTEVLSQVCPSCGERLPLDFNACPQCGVVFKRTNPQPISFESSPNNQTEIVEHYFPPIRPPKPKDKKSGVSLKPIRGIAIGRCPVCNKVLLKGWDKCQQCGWLLDSSTLLPYKK